MGKFDSYLNPPEPPEHPSIGLSEEVDERVAKLGEQYGEGGEAMHRARLHVFLAQFKDWDYSRANMVELAALAMSVAVAKAVDDSADPPTMGEDVW